jgi:F-type H+-transporting ATPase subunit a
MHGHTWQPTAAWGAAFAVMVLLLTLGLSAKKKIPGPLQNAWEFLYEWLYENSRQVVGEQGMRYFPLYICIFIYVFFNNLLGLVPFMASATAFTATTLGLAIVTALATHVLGFKNKGFGYVLHYFQVVDFRQGDGAMAKVILFMLQFFLLPIIEIIGAVAQPISLAARLFGNIFAKETILAVLAAMLVTLLHSPSLMDKGLALLPLALRPAIIILGVLVSLIQAVVFTVLSMVYISNATSQHHDEGHEAAAAH